MQIKCADAQKLCKDYGVEIKSRYLWMIGKKRGFAINKMYDLDGLTKWLGERSAPIPEGYATIEDASKIIGERCERIMHMVKNNLIAWVPIYKYPHLYAVCIKEAGDLSSKWLLAESKIPSNYMTVRDVSTALGVSVGKVRNEMHKNKLKGTYFYSYPHSARIDINEIKKYFLCK